MSQDPDPPGTPPDWTPEQERELDPARLQRESLTLMREFMDTFKKNKAKALADLKGAAAESALAEVGPPGDNVPGAFRMPPPPTFAQSKARYKKAWEATKEIAGDADPIVQCEIFRMLSHHVDFNADDSAMTGEARI